MHEPSNPPFVLRAGAAAGLLTAQVASAIIGRMKTLSIECPDALAVRLETLVREGWVADGQQAVVEALRRFLDSHRPELIETQILADVEWGLHGRD